MTCGFQWKARKLKKYIYALKSGYIETHNSIILVDYGIRLNFKLKNLSLR